MSSVPASVQNGQTPSTFWETMKQGWVAAAPYATPPVAAGVAIVPAFRFYIQKSDKQLERAVTRLSFMEGCRQGVKAVPNVAGLVGAQMAAQAAFERIYHRVFNKQQASQEGVGPKVASSAAVAAVSLYPVAIFNGQSAGMTAKQAIKALTRAQAGAIFAQECTFVGGVACSQPAIKKAKEVFGDHWAVKYASAFVAGAAGSGAGHAANTCITRWQQGKTMVWETMPRAEMVSAAGMKKIVQQLKLGFALRTIGGGVFTVGYTLVKDAMTPEAPKK